MINIYVVRHGETEYNAKDIYQGSSDVPLNEKGLEQAKLCAKELEHVHFDRILASDLVRARVTAETIAAYHKNAPLTIDKRLQEVHFGEWEERSFQEIETLWPGSIQRMYENCDTFEIPGGETFQEVQDRAWHAVKEEMDTMEDGQTLLVVCHGGTIRALLCKLLHLPLKHAWSFRQGNTAISRITYHGEDDCNILQLLNSTRHLGQGL